MEKKGNEKKNNLNGQEGKTDKLAEKEQAIKKQDNNGQAIKQNVKKEEEVKQENKKEDVFKQESKKEESREIDEHMDPTAHYARVMRIKPEEEEEGWEAVPYEDGWNQVKSM